MPDNDMHLAEDSRAGEITAGAVNRGAPAITP
jgi:hypothetical protein